MGHKLPAMAIRPQEHERLEQHWLRLQREATLLPLRNTFWNFALELYDLSFQLARGDSCDAAETARAGACGTHSAVNLNLKPYGNQRWAMGVVKEQANSSLALSA